MEVLVERFTMYFGWSVNLACNPLKKVSCGGVQGVIRLRRVHEHADKNLLFIGR